MHVRRFETARRSGPRAAAAAAAAMAYDGLSAYQRAIGKSQPKEREREWEREVDRSDPIRSVYRSLPLFRIKM
jgi:hypothetical protein